MSLDIDDTWIHPNTNLTYIYSLGGNDVIEADWNLAVDPTVRRCSIVQEGKHELPRISFRGRMSLRCGAVRYRAQGIPYDFSHCHCSTCRKATGAAFVLWLSFRCHEVAFTRGESTYFASSEKVSRGFCNQCGTALTYQIQDSDEIDVTVCSLDNPESVSPQDHIWTQDQLPWIKLADDLPCYRQRRT
jgi:hypothetical protein